MVNRNNEPHRSPPPAFFTCQGSGPREAARVSDEALANGPLLTCLVDQGRERGETSPLAGLQNFLLEPPALF